MSVPSVFCRDLTDRDGFIDKVTFEQRSEGDEGTSHVHIWKEVSWAQETFANANARDGTAWHLCGWSRASEGRIIDTESERRQEARSGQIGT